MRDLVGQMPHVEAARKGYAFLSPTGMVVADLRPQKERLRAEASKTVAETAGLTAWDREGSEGFDGGPTVRWYAADGDDTGYQRLAGVLAQLWRAEPESGPSWGGSPTVLPSHGLLNSGRAHERRCCGGREMRPTQLHRVPTLGYIFLRIGAAAFGASGRLSP